jgi:uncharacterized protein (AIM24 family)
MNDMTTQDARVQTLDALVDETGEQAAVDERFSYASARMIRIEVDGGVWLKPGAAVAYRGDLTFGRLPTLAAGSAGAAIVREVAPMVRAHGKGRLYCASHGAHVRIVRLAGEAIVVSWHDLLAFEESLEFDAALVGPGVGIAAGGLVAVTLTGHGSFALCTHGRPLTMAVSPDCPVSTDPHATLAWSPSLTPALKTDLSWRSLVGHGGQEPFQMFFAGTGFVVVQASEDPSRFNLSGNPLKRLATLVSA